MAEEIGFGDGGEGWGQAVGVIFVVAGFAEEEVGVIIVKAAFLASFYFRGVCGGGIGGGAG